MGDDLDRLIRNQFEKAWDEGAKDQKERNAKEAAVPKDAAERIARNVKETLGNSDAYKEYIQANKDVKEFYAKFAGEHEKQFAEIKKKLDHPSLENLSEAGQKQLQEQITKAMEDMNKAFTPEVTKKFLELGERSSEAMEKLKIQIKKQMPEYQNLPDEYIDAALKKITPDTTKVQPGMAPQKSAPAFGVNEQGVNDFLKGARDLLSGKSAANDEVKVDKGVIQQFVEALQSLFAGKSDDKGVSVSGIVDAVLKLPDEAKNVLADALIADRDKTKGVSITVPQFQAAPPSRDASVPPL